MLARVLPLLAVATACFGAQAGETLPILRGRYASEACRGAPSSAERVFTPGATSTPNERCALEIKGRSANVYQAHLACRYAAAEPAQDDVVLEVNGSRSVTWINQCMAIRYHYCGPE